MEKSQPSCQWSSLEPEKGIVSEETSKRYQEKLGDYADWKRRCRHRDLVVEDVVFVATLSKGKLTPNFSGNNYVILKKKESDTFELVQVETRKREIRNAKFLRKAPLHIEVQR